MEAVSARAPSAPRGAGAPAMAGTGRYLAAGGTGASQRPRTARTGSPRACWNWAGTRRPHRRDRAQPRQWLLLFYAAARIGVAVVGLSALPRQRDRPHDRRCRRAGRLHHRRAGRLRLPRHAGIASRRRCRACAVVVLDAPDAGQAAPPAAATAPQAPLTLSALARSAPQPGWLARAAAAVHADDPAMVIYTSAPPANQGAASPTAPCWPPPARSRACAPCRATTCSWRCR